MKLREYQETFITNVARMFRTSKRGIGQLATGGGKTVIFCGIANRYIKKSGKRVLILVHRIELLKQTRRTAYEHFQLICEPIVAGQKFIPEADIYVGMVESTRNRIAKLSNIGMVIIDECHIASFHKMHQLFPEALILGMTATPISSVKKKPLKNFYEDIVVGPSISELIRLGNLCQNITWSPKEIVDRAKLKTLGDDFDEEDMSKQFARPKFVTNTVAQYELHCKGLKTIIFNVSVYHSQVVTDAFVAKGYAAKHLDGETPKAEREQILYWYKYTPDAILCNVGIATTGFDEPTTRAIIVNKATKQMPHWIQLCGRGSRPSHGKDIFFIVDMGGNALAHGDWHFDRDWRDLFENPPKPGKDSAAPARSCPNCDAILHASARACPYCGYIFPTKEIPAEVILHEFVVVTKNIDVTKLIEETKQRKEYYSLFELGRILATQAVGMVPVMSDEYATFILSKYHDLGRQWTKAKGKKFNRWHQVKTAEILYNHLKALYPKWETKLLDNVNQHNIAIQED